MKLDQLENIARAATPGPWCANLLDVMAADGGTVSRSWGCRGKYQLEEPNALHIAAFDPPTALKLIAVCHAAQDVANGEHGSMPRLRAALAVLESE